MIIRNFNTGGTGTILRPLETNSPLVVDADAVLPGTVAPQRFQAVARQAAQVAYTCGGGKDFEPLVCLPANARESCHPLARCELCRPLIPQAHYHTSDLPAFTHDVKRIGALADVGRVSGSQRLCGIGVSASRWAHIQVVWPKWAQSGHPGCIVQEISYQKNEPIRSVAWGCEFPARSAALRRCSRNANGQVVPPQSTAQRYPRRSVGQPAAARAALHRHQKSKLRHNSTIVAFCS